MFIREAGDDEFKRRAWRSQQTNEHAMEAVKQFMDTDWDIAYIGKWPIPRTPAARSRATRKAVNKQGLEDQIKVRQANGSVYLVRLNEVA